MNAGFPVRTEAIAGAAVVAVSAEVHFAAIAGVAIAVPVARVASVSNAVPQGADGGSVRYSAGFATGSAVGY